jgi:hypothetical protein
MLLFLLQERRLHRVERGRRVDEEAKQKDKEPAPVEANPQFLHRLNQQVGMVSF